MHERQVGYWKLGLKLNSPLDVTRGDVKHKRSSDFLPRIFADINRIFQGDRKGEFVLAPSDFYIAVLESHLAGPMGPA